MRYDLALARPLLHPRLVLRLPMVVSGLLEIEGKHPPEPPHWYLAILGTEPAAQGRGFYGRHGFRVTAEVRLPRGPRIWSMWWTFRDGMPWRCDVFIDRGRALEAAGLRE